MTMIIKILQLYLFLYLGMVTMVMGVNNARYDRGFIYANHKIRIWDRIPNGIENVNDEIWNFLESNTITNCFKFRETENELRLRCLSNGRLIDANIYVHNNNKKREPNEAFTTRIYI